MDLSATNNIVDITLENFQQVILQESQEKLILVDFWAQWCEPCKDMMPILEKIAREYQKVLILAKVDCDEQQEVAAQFGIRSLPTVMVVKDGQPVDGFAGAQTESQIREMLAKYLPQPEDEDLQKAAQAIEAGDYQGAFPFAKQAYDLNPENIDSRYMYIDCLVETGSIEQAKAELETIKLVDQDSRYQVLLGKIELAEQAADTPEIKQLQEAVEREPENLQLKIELAVQLQQARKVDQALALLHSVLLKDLNFGEAKKLMLDMINALPDGEPLKSAYRRKVYSLLY
ncbi:thioredoxin [Alteromonas pelagimontana]|uniref:Thioredoxin n=1 Tax=Alteromonas pelagimontana TaxID=1858656 RepID=A0A6M4MCX1_9ALTE|nr:thioredoxin [Alteromonas pelagimontana]QJR80490.1 thioredoxin [Alteromonas pelagimontana]